MRIKWTMITGVSFLLILAGLYVALTERDGPAAKQFVFTIVGLLGWWAGHKLVELEERVQDLERQQEPERPVNSGLRAL